ncbi:GntR family transcriptional regulator [Planococcus maritimus]|uniref:GntR family transcriptional regulator n=1 Tax=Planococcus maritimus TaxID=192421 RepID=UPI00079A4A37|nr:GntR family transcriptional regulator [Planococcus maritimus]KYG60067.1 GntR family transcriptional regulator [Planococcus maritimus]OED33753.1 GntR family transcriptional regulator [Planococcus maritimus]
MYRDDELQLFIGNLQGMDEYRLPQRAYHTIRLAIRDLILPPGTALLEREISEALQMSRTPVREALVRLEIEGVVRLVPRRGFIVEPIEQEDLKEVYEIITTLDSLAIDMATQNATKQELDQLEAIIEEQQAALAQEDLKKWSYLDDLFHSKIIEYARNKRLKTVIDSFADQSYRARLFTINDRPLPMRSIVEHKAIVFCMLAKDGKAASMLIQSHRRRAQKEILEVLGKINQLKVDGN